MTSGAPPSATRDLLRSLVRHGWLFALVLVPAVVLLVQTPTPAPAQVGSVTVGTRPANDARIGEQRLFDAYIRRHIDTFAQLATTNAVLETAIAQGNLSTTPRDLAARITVVRPENREVVSLEVSGRDRDEVLVSAQAVGESLATRIEALSPRDTRGGTLVRAQSSTASVSEVPGERPLLPIIAMAALGLMAAAAWVLWRFATDDVLRNRRDLASVTNAPVLATFRPGETDPTGAHLLRLHLDSLRDESGMARLVGTTASADEAFEVRERLLGSYGTTDRTPPHIEVIHPARVPVVPDALVVAAVGRVTVTRLVHLLCTIEERGGSVSGVIAHVPRRGLGRLRRRSSS